MSTWDDLEDEMERTLDVHAAERLVSGSLAPDDWSAEYAAVACLLDAARAAPAAGELAREAETVAAMARVVRSRARVTVHPNSRRRFMLIHPLRVRTIAALTAAVLAATCALAAAGTLPGPAQDVVSKVLSELGISLPDEAGGVDPEDATPPAAGKGLAIAELATASEARSVERGALVSAAASGGKSRAGERGAPAGAGEASVATPNEGGTATADTASGSSSSAGSSRADGASGGASAEGSNNADSADEQVPPSAGTASTGAGNADAGLVIDPPPGSG